MGLFLPSSLSPIPALSREGEEGSTSRTNLWVPLSVPDRGLSILLEKTGAHMAGKAWATSHQAPGLPGLSPPCEGHVPSVSPATSQLRPGLTRPLIPGSRGSGAPGLALAMASAHLARLVELLLQPRHRHSAFRRPTSRRDPANRRDSASDRLPGAADPPRASAGPVGTASTALSPAPFPPLRRLSPSRARAARILHGNRTLPAPSAHARPLLSG